LPFQEANLDFTLSTNGWRYLNLGAPTKVGTPRYLKEIYPLLHSITLLILPLNAIELSTIKNKLLGAFIH